MPAKNKYDFIWELVNNTDPYCLSQIFFEDYDYTRAFRLELDSVPLNKWVYITCVNKNNQITVYYDGIKQGSIEYNKNLELNKGGYLFSAHPVSNKYFGIYGYIFDFFISDKAEWTSNFTPPNTPFEDSGRGHIYLDNDKNIWGCSKL